MPNYFEYRINNKKLIKLFKDINDTGQYYIPIPSELYIGVDSDKHVLAINAFIRRTFNRHDKYTNYYRISEYIQRSIFLSFSYDWSGDDWSAYLPTSYSYDRREKPPREYLPRERISCRETFIQYLIWHEKTKIKIRDLIEFFTLDSELVKKASRSFKINTYKYNANTFIFNYTAADCYLSNLKGKNKVFKEEYLKNTKKVYKKTGIDIRLHFDTNWLKKKVSRLVKLRVHMELIDNLLLEVSYRDIMYGPAFLAQIYSLIEKYVQTHYYAPFKSVLHTYKVQAMRSKELALIAYIENSTTPKRIVDQQTFFDFAIWMATYKISDGDIIRLAHSFDDVFTKTKKKANLYHYSILVHNVSVIQRYSAILADKTLYLTRYRIPHLYRKENFKGRNKNMIVEEFDESDYWRHGTRIKREDFISDYWCRPGLLCDEPDELMFESEYDDFDLLELDEFQDDVYIDENDCRIYNDYFYDKDDDEDDDPYPNNQNYKGINTFQCYYEDWRDAILLETGIRIYDIFEK